MLARHITQLRKAAVTPLSIPVEPSLSRNESNIFAVGSEAVFAPQRLLSEGQCSPKPIFEFFSRFAHAALLTLFALFCIVPNARAQFTGFSVPQTITTTPFNATSCTGAQQVALIPNLGQTEHFLTITTAGGVLAFRATVQGSHDGTTFNDISDVATNPGATIEGQGYYPVVQVSVTCASAVGNFTVKYSGQATAPAPQMGGQSSSQIDKTLAIAVPSNANFTAQLLRAPFGTTGGAIYFLYSAAGPAGSTLNVACSTLQINGSTVSIASFPLTTSNTLQIFPVPLLPCDFVTVAYTSGGASATTFSMSYVFNGQAITGGDPCQGSTSPKSAVAINVGAATTQQLVAPLAGHSVYVCGFNFTLTGTAASTATFTFGTGATCGGSTVTFSGAMAVVANTVQAIDSGGGGYTVAKSAPASGWCITTAGAGSSGQGIGTFIQQ